MKTTFKVAAACVLALASGSGFAQSYAGALLELSRYQITSECRALSAAIDCKNKGTGLKLYAGTNESDTSLEVAYINFGKAKPELSGVGGEVSAKAIVLAAVVRFKPLAILPDLSINGKAGLASVKTVLKVPGVLEAEESHPSLYLGLGADYPVYKGVRAVIAIDHVEGELNGSKFGVQSLALGAQMAF